MCVSEKLLCGDRQGYVWDSSGLHAHMILFECNVSVCQGCAYVSQKL